MQFCFECNPCGVAKDAPEQTHTRAHTHASLGNQLLLASPIPLSELPLLVSRET